MTPSPGSDLTVNVSKILELGRMRRAFTSMIPHLLKADDADVKDALEVQAARRSNGWRTSRDGLIRFGPSIPMSWSMRPRCEVHRPFDKYCLDCNLYKDSQFLGLETMDEDQKKVFVKAYSDSMPKLSV